MIDVVFAAGDVGGARALLPLIVDFQNRGLRVAVVAHGVLDEETPNYILRISPEVALDIDTWQNSRTQTLVYATSVSDKLSVKIAAIANRSKNRTVHILDNWSSYAHRLNLDDSDVVIPTFYCVMDRLAFEDAIKDGVPTEILRITGQPSVAKLADEISVFKDQASLHEKTFLFVSEPASGGVYRGYDESSVAKLFTDALTSLGHNADFRPNLYDIDFAIVPHPREDRTAVSQLWTVLFDSFPRLNGQRLSYRFVSEQDVRLSLHKACWVAGMSSILLYEAWLLSKPVLSLQPELIRSQNLKSLRALECREGLVFCDNSSNAISDLNRLLTTKPVTTSIKPASLLAQHVAASQMIYEIVTLPTQ